LNRDQTLGQHSLKKKKKKTLGKHRGEICHAFPATKRLLQEEKCLVSIFSLSLVNPRTRNEQITIEYVEYYKLNNKLKKKER